MRTGSAPHPLRRRRRRDRRAGVCKAFLDPDVRAILIAPSNPYLSVNPILAVPEIAAALGAAPAPMVAVSPIVGGEAVKGPTAKLMREMGIAVSATSIATHYGAFLDAILIPVPPSPPHAATR